MECIEDETRGTVETSATSFVCQIHKTKYNWQFAMVMAMRMEVEVNVDVADAVALSDGGELVGSW